MANVCPQLQYHGYFLQIWVAQGRLMGVSPGQCHIHIAAKAPLLLLQVEVVVTLFDSRPLKQEQQCTVRAWSPTGHARVLMSVLILLEGKTPCCRHMQSSG